MPTILPEHASAVDGSSSGPSPTERNRGLLLVGLFKLSKAIFFFALGAGALHLMHSNVREVTLHLVGALRLDPESHLVNLLLDRANVIGFHQLRNFGLLFFGYSAICLIEGTGLLLEKEWAEYITVILTVLGLPWETYEIILRVSLLKIALLLVNFAVLLYLLWILKRKRESQPVLS